MKTLKLILLFCGIIFFNLAYSFTALNLPLDVIYENPVDKLLVFENPDIIFDIETSEKSNDATPNTEDTIVIDLDEIVITDGFPERSHDCLQRQVKYPDFAVKQKLEGVVAVTMLFNRDGNVEIVDSFGSDSRLESYVHGQLYNLHLRNCSVEMNKPYNLRFTFRLF
ncbi:MAG: energy transducer TonB [Planctomycetes bacterium]|nr:energy transducer TonB [Planctomycetota bacterium]